MRRYDGQVALVTGAAQGLGRAMALRFAEEGADLALCDIDGVNLEKTAELATSAFGRSVCVARVDVADSGEVSGWVADTIRSHGAVDVVVSNAGIIRDDRAERLSDSDWRAVVDVSLTGAFHLARAVLPFMKERRYGRLLFLSSMSWRGNFGQANYAAAKAGLVGLGRTLALEGAPFGITSNVIAPGLINTPMLASMNSRARDKLGVRIPLGAIGEPGDIAEAAAYLCSRAAGYVTGVVLDVDGGIGIGSSIR